MIFLTFKDVKFDTWETTLEKIRALLQEEYGRHQELENSGKLTGYEKEYFAKILNATANEVALSAALENLSYGFLTGILRIAQESIFSGLNNLTVNSVMDKEYESYFGFTQEEVTAMLSYYGVSEKRMS